jgi:hypothetical protein
MILLCVTNKAKEKEIIIKNIKYFNAIIILWIIILWIIIMFKYKFDKYQQKINIIGGKKKKITNFYFLHNTFGIDNLLEILDSGILKLGSEVEEEKRRLSGGEPMEKIFMNIYFPDLKNIQTSVGLIFSHKLFYDYDLQIDAGWGNKKILEIQKSDSKNSKNKALDKIKNYIADPGTILAPHLVKLLTDILSHQIIFFKQIPIKKYLVAICYGNASNDIIKQIKETVEKNKLDNVKCISKISEI